MLRAQASASVYDSVCFSGTLAATCCRLQLLRWVQGARQDAAASPGDRATFVSGWDHFWKITFSPKGKMLVGFASYFVFTFEVALVHLPVFTESYIWDAFL